jgi:hypothetical protein
VSHPEGATHSVEAASGNRPISLVVAIIAVLAALGTLFAHHRSIHALSSKNQAILVQGRATDTYNAYEAGQIRLNIYQALVASDLVRSAKTKAKLESVADKVQTSSAATLEKAQSLEEQAKNADERSDRLMKSYETLQFATTMFEVSIVLVSISALAGTRVFLPVGCTLSAVGLVFFIVGLVQYH